MGSSRISLKRSLLLSTLAALSLFSTTALAQAQSDSTAKVATGANTNSETAATTTAKDENTAPATSSTTAPKLPGLSSSTTTTGAQPKLTGLPTLSKTTSANTVPTYPPPSPPPTQNAPFMNQSTLPDGTVFIAVGAILGLFGAAILLWRGIVAYLLKRSVERAAMAQHATNDKVAASFPAPPETFYKYTDDSSASLAAGVVAGRGQRRTNRGPMLSQTPSTTNLFFSPTAAGGAGGSVNSANRHSFLPSGFYAATSAAPAASQGHGQSISLSTLNPASNRGSHIPVRQTPPDSPELAARTTPPHGHLGRGHNFSTSSVSLNVPPSGRAPSAYLDDLLDEQPGAFPPAAPQGGGHYRGFNRQPSY